MKIQKNHSLKNNNTFGIDATAECFVEYSSPEDLQAIGEMAWRGELPLPIRPIGGGSNILLTQDRINGTILHSGIKSIEVLSADDKTVRVRVGSGVVWDDFVEMCVFQGWWGAENLSLVPGEVGGAAVQNIGAYGAEAKDIIESVECFDLEAGMSRLLSCRQCEYGYRESIFKLEKYRQCVIMYVIFKLSQEPVCNFSYKALSDRMGGRKEGVSLADIRQTIIDIRSSKLPDPSVIGSAGSFFKNPVVTIETYEQIKAEYPDIPSYTVAGRDDVIKLSAGWMIDRCGWKGKSLGRAGIYEHQALVLVNRGGATGAEIVALADAVIASVRGKFGVELSMEVCPIS